MQVSATPEAADEARRVFEADMAANSPGVIDLNGWTQRALVPGRQHSREDLEAAGMELPNLNHKSSFGDRPVHYLIPDMPPPMPRK